MIVIDLSQRQALDADPKAIQQINFAENLNWSEFSIDNTTMFFNTEEAKKTILDFWQGRETIIILFCFNIISI